jgi:hypothetical protein
MASYGVETNPAQQEAQRTIHEYQAYLFAVCE